jgi:hypothetical protein
MKTELLAVATLVSASITGVSTVVYNIVCQNYQQIFFPRVDFVDDYSCECLEEYCPPCPSPSPSPSPMVKNNNIDNLCKAMLAISTMGAFSTVLLSSYEFHSLGHHNNAVEVEYH